MLAKHDKSLMACMASRVFVTYHLEGKVRLTIAAILFALLTGSGGAAQTQKPAYASSTSEKIIIDTDIGDDIDDAFAVGLALKSPELEILGMSTTFGDTEARAKILDRMLGEAGRDRGQSHQCG